MILLFMSTFKLFGGVTSEEVGPDPTNHLDNYIYRKSGSIIVWFWTMQQQQTNGAIWCHNILHCFIIPAIVTSIHISR
jgi:hypothetical protein